MRDQIKDPMLHAASEALREHPDHMRWLLYADAELHRLREQVGLPTPSGYAQGEPVYPDSPDLSGDAWPRTTPAPAHRDVVQVLMTEGMARRFEARCLGVGNTKGMTELSPAMMFREGDVPTYIIAVDLDPAVTPPDAWEDGLGASHLAPESAQGGDSDG